MTSTIFTPEEKRELIYCISLRINLILTGDPNMNAEDAAAMKMQDKIRPLAIEQMKFIVAMTELQKRIQEL